jgi:hypothetical protein
MPTVLKRPEPVRAQRRRPVDDLPVDWTASRRQRAAELVNDDSGERVLVYVQPDHDHGDRLRFPRFSGHPSAWSESRSVMKEERYATEVSAALSAGVPA